jgi:catalase
MRTTTFDLRRYGTTAGYPLIEVGVMELNHNPDIYFVDVSWPSSTGKTSCRASASRLTKCCRAASSATRAPALPPGVIHYLIPVNKPRCPMHGYSSDGQMRVDVNYGAALGYEPTLREWQAQPEYKERARNRGSADIWTSANDEDYSPSRASSSADATYEQERLFSQHARAMGMRARGQIWHFGNCTRPSRPWRGCAQRSANDERTRSDATAGSVTGSQGRGAVVRPRPPLCTLRFEPSRHSRAAIASLRAPVASAWDSSPPP